MDGVEEGVLRSALEKFGTVKTMDIVRNKACAFIEFEKLESAKRAITASLPKNQGGLGGLAVETLNGETRLSVETKKERGERQINRPRGGGPGQGVNGESGRNAYRGRGGPRGRGGAPKS